MRKFEEMILDFLKILEKLSIKYAIIGGVAVSSWGNPRTTQDLDIIVVLKSSDTDEFCEKLQQKQFSISKKDMKTSLKHKTHFTIFDELSEYHIDVKGIYSPSDAITIKNRRSVSYEGYNMYIASPEDTIAHKLLYGGYQDIEDAKSILIQHSDLDMDYLEELCRKLAVLDEFKNIKKIANDFKSENKNL